MSARQIVGVQCLLAILWFLLTCLDLAITLGHGVISQWVQRVSPGGSRLCNCTNQLRAPMVLTVQSGLKCVHLEFVLF